MRNLVKASLVVTALGTSACKFAELPPVDPDALDSGTLSDASIDVPTTCSPNTTTCSGQLLTVCDAQGTPTNTPCNFGCAGSNDRCNDLAPSNGLSARLDVAATANPLVLTGNASIDTSAGTVTNGNGSSVIVTSMFVTGGPVEIMAISVKSLSAGNVQVRGSRALAILVDENVTISGNLSASAAFDVPGAGALTTANAGACDGNPGGTGAGYAGSGGGAHGTNGGAGGWQSSIVGGQGGMAAGDPTNAPLRGGCPGGSLRGPGGAGGGAIQISARGSITIQAGAFVSAGGGAAQGWTANMTDACFSGSPCDAGGGGGAGGAILLEASSIAMDTNGGVVANGGAGHWGKVGQGQNGQLSESAAMPYSPSGCSSCPLPGRGAAGAAPATDGASSTMWEGAGGGGGAGRIRINLPAGATFDSGPPTVSPNPTIGAATLR